MIKRRIFDIIQPDRGCSRLSRIFDWLITALILASVVSVFVATFDLPKGVRTFLTAFDGVASVIFTVEYALRIWTADLLYSDTRGVRSRMRYVCSAMAIVDLLAILPFWLPMVLPGSMLGMRALRLVRLLRILKLNRYFDAMQFLWQVVAAKKRELLGSVFFVFLLMLVSSLLMYAAEHEAQPEVFKNAFSGLWWAIATLTTVGYGDIYPVTVIGRILGAVIALSGVAALAIPTGIVTSGLMERVGAANVEDEAEARAVKDIEHDKELARQREKDVEHDALIAAQQKMLRDISAQMIEIKAALVSMKTKIGD